MRSLRFGSLALIVFAVSAFGQELTPDQTVLKQKLLGQPPPGILELATRRNSQQRPSAIDAPIVVNVDLDGSGNFSYFIALFVLEGDPAGFLRVFKEEDGKLLVAGDQDTDRQVGGWGVQIELTDVNGDGIPEVKVTSMSHDGQSEYFSLFSWTGSALHDMVGHVVGNGALEDIDNDGVMEIFADNPAGKGFDIFKLSGSSYVFSQTVEQDPSGLSAKGNINYVRAFCKSLDPPRFSLPEIRQALARKSRDGGQEHVRLTFGGLQRVNADFISVEQLDTSSIAVNPHLAPVRISVHPGGDDARGTNQNDDKGRGKSKNREICGAERGRISVEVDRVDFLRALQRLQFTAPLAAGDKLEVNLRAKLRDGTPVGAVFTAEIVGNSDKDDPGRSHDTAK